jgi:cellulose synthase/poly-beta-1,6-N-acetylglucosamine synthase-like glycosyltransferase
VVEVFQALDFMVLQGITAASVSSRFHSMANGANLAYTKVAFANVNGFEGIDRVASGDDMLLMYKIWKQGSEGVVYLKSKTAIVSTQPMATWGAFFQQRRRWASKTFYYDDKRVLAVAAFVYLFNVWCVVLLVAGLINDSHIWLLWVFLLIKFIIEFPFVFSVSRFYDEKALMLYFPFFQPLHILYTVSVGLWSQWGSYKWKGRKTM